MYSRTGVHDELDVEWFNVWWDQTRQSALRTAEALIAPISSNPAFVVSHRTPGHALAAATRAALLARDIADIEKARDALDRPGTLSFLQPAWSHRRLGGARDVAPIVLGGIVGILLVSVFSAAAAFMKFARS